MTKMNLPDLILEADLVKLDNYISKLGKINSCYAKACTWLALQQPNHALLILEEALLEDHEQSPHELYIYLRALISTGNARNINTLSLNARLEPLLVASINLRLKIATSTMGESFVLATRYLDEFPRSPEILSLSASLSSENSSAYFCRSIAILNRQPTTYFNMAMACLRDGNFEGAMEHLEACVQQLPCFSLAITHLITRFHGQMPSKSIANIWESMPTWCRTDNMVSLFIDTWLERKEFSQVRSIVDIYFDKKSNSDQLNISLACALQALGRPDQARKLYKRLVEQSQSSDIRSRCYNNLAVERMSDGDPVTAIDYLEIALDISDSDIEIELNLARALSLGSELSAAVEILNKFEAISTNLSRRQHLLLLETKALIYSLAGDSVRSYSFIKDIVDRYPNSDCGWRLLASYYEIKGQVQISIQTLAKALTSVCYSMSLTRELISIILDQEHYDYAIEVLKKIQDRWESDVTVEQSHSYREVLADIEIRQGNFKIAEKILLTDSHTASGTLALAKLYYYIGDYESSVVACEASIAADSSLIAPRILLANAKTRLSLLQDALEAIDQALRIEPTRYDIISSRIRTHSQLESPPKVLSWAIEYHKASPTYSLFTQLLSLCRDAGDISSAYCLINDFERLYESRKSFVPLKAAVLRMLDREQEGLELLHRHTEQNPSDIYNLTVYINELISQKSYAKAKHRLDLIDINGLSSLVSKIEIISLYNRAGYSDIALENLDNLISNTENRDLDVSTDETDLKLLRIDLIKDSQSPADALDYCQALLRTSPFPHVYSKVLSLCLECELLDAALDISKNWIKTNPDIIQPIWAQVDIYIARQEYTNALQVLDGLESRLPNSNKITITRAAIYGKLKLFSSSLSLLAVASKREPTNPAILERAIVSKISLGDFATYDEDTKSLFSILGPEKYKYYPSFFFGMNCHPQMTAEEIYRFYQEWYEKTLAPKATTAPRYLAQGKSDSSRVAKIRVGYVSGDFRRHSVAYFSEPLIRYHDRDRFSLHLFSNLAVPAHDAYTDRFKDYADSWHDIFSKSDAQVTRLIDQIGIDILVDLSGHTAGNRLPLFYSANCKLKLSWIFGSGQTTGMRCVDYLISPEGILASKDQSVISENLKILPLKGLPYIPPLDLERHSLPAKATQSESFCFASITRPIRINNEVIRVWSSIMRRCNDAVLAFDHPSYVESEVRAFIVSRFAENGVRLDRLLFRNSRPYLSVFHNADVVLDAFPSGSGTTATDAIYVGIPVVCMKDRSPVGAITACQLSSTPTGSTLIARTHREYVEMAVSLYSRGRIATKQLGDQLASEFRLSDCMSYEKYSKAVSQFMQEALARKDSLTSLSVQAD